MRTRTERKILRPQCERKVKWSNAGRDVGEERKKAIITILMFCTMLLASPEGSHGNQNGYESCAATLG